MQISRTGRSLRMEERGTAPGCDPEHTASRRFTPPSEMRTAPRPGDGGAVREGLGSAAGEGRLGRLVDHEDLREAGDPEDLEQAVLVADQLEGPVVGADLLQAADQDTEPGRVQELDGFHVDDDVVDTGRDELGDLVPQLRGGVDVDLATDRNDGLPIDIAGRKSQVHFVSPWRHLDFIGCRLPWRTSPETRPAQ